MVSDANLEALRAEGIEYVIAERLRRSTANEALARAGQSKRVSCNLEVKAIQTVGGERVLVCRNRERAAEDARQRARRYLKLSGATAEIDLKKVQADARLEVKWVLRTTASLPTEQVALAYRGLWHVESAFRTI